MIYYDFVTLNFATVFFRDIDFTTESIHLARFFLDVLYKFFKFKFFLLVKK